MPPRRKSDPAAAARASAEHVGLTPPAELERILAPDPPTLEARIVGLSAEQIGQLNGDLDPSRVKRRQGRGRNQFEYLAGHDVIRTANRIFGFGRWGHEIVEQVCEEAVPVENDRGSQGWHIAYRCVVRVQVAGCVPTSGSGYGDAVEYGPAAKATARELALKEAETDALKRALKNYGDQFGLSLYEKDTDRRRAAQDEPSHQPVRARDPERPVPKTFAEINARLERADPYAGWAFWIRQALEVCYPGGTNSVRDLSPGASTVFGQRLASITLKVEDAAGDLGVMQARETIARIFAETIPELKGEVLEGPPWRLGPEPSEDGRPTYDEYMQIEAEKDAEPVDEAAADAVESAG